MTKESLSHKSGIYKITNTINQKIYVGSAVNLQARFNLHKTNLRANNHHSKKLQNSWNKYGSDFFIFSVIELVEKDILIAKEQYYFNLLNPFGANGYNTATVAGSSLGTKRSDEKKEKIRIASGSRKHTEESKRKISASKKGVPSNIDRKTMLAHIAILSINRTGKKQSPEHCAKTRVAMLGKKHSEETKKRMSEAQKNIAPEVRKKMNENNKLRVTDEFRKKCSIASTGRLHSKETKKIMSDARMGSKLSAETIAKRTETRRKNAKLLGKTY
jgi:group I intron endonuclease